jgi:betaine-aldehyde dehydrogenase
MGNPFDESTQVGALISREHVQRVKNYILSGIGEGAVLAAGGAELEDKLLSLGNYVKPTVFIDCHDAMKMVREEIFGPVMSVMVFDMEEEVIARANQSTYGLSAGLFTEDIRRAHRVANQLEAGVCWINNYNQTPVGMPFGGRKHSGFGRENGLSALYAYSQQKSIYLELKGIDCPYA